jgi:hypothetical protein
MRLRYAQLSLADNEDPFSGFLLLLQLVAAPMGA